MRLPAHTVLLAAVALLCVAWSEAEAEAAAEVAGTWRVYVEAQMVRALSSPPIRANNFFHALVHLRHATPPRCPALLAPHVMDQHVVTRSPCGSLHVTHAATYGALPAATWSILCPKQLWLELRLRVLELPLSGGSGCEKAALLFHSLLGEPATATYCGKVPQHTLYASPLVRITQRISLLLSPLRLHLLYEVVSPKPYTLGRRSPVVLAPGNTWMLAQLPLRLLSATMYTYAVYLPHNGAQREMRVQITSPRQCAYVVHDGPGHQSPVLARSDGASMSLTSSTSLYLVFRGAPDLCAAVNITITERERKAHQYTHSFIHRADEGPIDCSNEVYFLRSYNKDHLVIQINSTSNVNAWCKIVLLPYYYPWTLLVDLEFEGANYDVGYDSSCPFGALHFVRFNNSNTRKICVTKNIPAKQFSTINLYMIYMQFYEGYSSGKLTLTFLKLSSWSQATNWDLQSCVGVHCYLEANSMHSSLIVSDGNDNIIDTNEVFVDMTTHLQFSRSTRHDIEDIHILVMAGHETEYLGLVRLAAHVSCLGNSECDTNITMGLGLTTSSSSLSTSRYSQSFSLETQREHLRVVAVRVWVRPVDIFSFSVRVEKIQQCNYTTPTHQVQQLRYSDCRAIHIDNSVQLATFIAQPLQELTIHVPDSCPAKHCIKLNITYRGIDDKVALKRWVSPALQYRPVVHNMPGYVSLSWANDPNCETDLYFVERSCPIGINITIKSYDIPARPKYNYTVGEHYTTFYPSEDIEQLLIDNLGPISWHEAEKRCAEYNASLPLWKSPAEVTDVLSHGYIHPQATHYLFLGLLHGATGWRWTDGSPLVNFEFWGRPDIFHVHGENDWFQFTEPEFTDPLYPSPVNNKTCAAAVLSHIAMKMNYTWITLPCHTPFNMRLICQKQHRKHETWVPYCLGQTSVVRNHCIVYVDIDKYAVDLEICKPFRLNWVSSSGGVDDVSDSYIGALRSLFPVLSNITRRDVAFQAASAAAKSHVCLVALPATECDGGFRCWDFSCIPSSKQCNRIADCPHGEDEHECGDWGCEERDCHSQCTWPHCRCQPQYFQCLGSGGCVAADSVCDFEQNCADGSDEAHCGALKCSAGERACADGRMCVVADKWADGVEDCADASDEEQQQQGGGCAGFLCADGVTCIPATWRNNAIPDCKHDEDEAEFLFQMALHGTVEWACEDPAHMPCGGGAHQCYARTRRCVYEADSRGNIYGCRNARHLAQCEAFQCGAMFKCHRAYCVALSRVCDGVRDCQDGSDETYCPLLSCPGLFRCQHTCIHPQDVCDGKVDCKGSGDDEKYCHTKLVADDHVESNILSLPSVIQTRRIRIVALQYHGITEIKPYETTQESGVIVLDLGYNNITQIPALAFAACPNLYYLFLSNNKISSIVPLAFEKIRELSILDLAHNALTILQESSFIGLEMLHSIDVSHNALFSIEETFFTAWHSLASVFHSDGAICCMLPPNVLCGVDPAAAGSCSDLLLHSAFTYTVMAVGVIVSFSCGICIIVHLLDYKNIMHLSLAFSDALYGCYLVVLSLTDLYWKGRFSFYANAWPTSPVCYSLMLTFFSSFQQSLLILVYMTCHTCVLIAWPFKKRLHQKLMLRSGSIWLVAAIQVSLLVLTLTTLHIPLASSDQFCQSPSTTASPLSILFFTLQAIYGVGLLAFVAATCAVVVLIRNSLQLKSATSTRFKQQVLKKSVAVAIVNVISLGSAFVVEVMRQTGFAIDSNVLLSMTITLMAMSKLCNPCIHSVRLMRKIMRSS